MRSPGKKKRAGTDYTRKELGRKVARQKYADLGKCNRCEAPATDRHHKDENTWNNAPENIEFLCSSCHSRHHATRTERLGCVVCGKESKPLRKGMCNACYEYNRRGRGSYRHDRPMLDRKLIEKRICRECGAAFETVHRKKIYCTHKCANAVSVRTYRQRIADCITERGQ